jgi:hypothetical protein
LIAANLAANVALNAALFPFGYVGMFIFTDGLGTGEKNPDVSSKTAHLGYEAVLVNSKGKIRWENHGVEYFNLYHVTSEKEQSAVLVRNVVLRLEGELPFYLID